MPWLAPGATTSVKFRDRLSPISSGACRNVTSTEVELLVPLLLVVVVPNWNTWKDGSTARSTIGERRKFTLRSPPSELRFAMRPPISTKSPRPMRSVYVGSVGKVALVIVPSVLVVRKPQASTAIEWLTYPEPTVRGVV